MLLGGLVGMKCQNLPRKNIVRFIVEKSLLLASVSFALRDVSFIVHGNGELQVAEFFGPFQYFSV